MSRWTLFAAFFAGAALVMAGVDGYVERALAEQSLTTAASASLFTTAQADRGRDEYDHNCLTCHGENLDDGDFGGAPLRGAYFRNHWGAGDLGVLFAFIKTLMPPDNPGSLNDEEYANILAYILERNHYKPGLSPLPTDPAALRRLKLNAGPQK